MPKVKITLTVEDSLIKLVRAGHGNISKYVNELIKRDMFKQYEPSIYDDVVKRLIADGYIGAKVEYTHTSEPVVIPDYQ